MTPKDEAIYRLMNVVIAANFDEATNALGFDRVREITRTIPEAEARDVTLALKKAQQVISR